jgi:hypothetical protein
MHATGGSMDLHVNHNRPGSILPNPPPPLPHPHRQPHLRRLRFHAVLKRHLVLRYQVQPQSLAELLHVLAALVSSQMLSESHLRVNTSRPHIDAQLPVFHLGVLCNKLLVL